MKKKKKHNHPVTGKTFTPVGEFVCFLKNARWNNPFLSVLPSFEIKKHCPECLCVFFFFK